jgi:hypothetical protein
LQSIYYFSFCFLCSENSEKIAVLAAFKQPYLFTSAQLLLVCDVTPSLKTKLEFISSIGPRLIDPASSADKLLGLFRYATEKSAVEKILKDRNLALTSSQFSTVSSVGSASSNAENSSANSSASSSGSAGSGVASAAVAAAGNRGSISILSRGGRGGAAGRGALRASLTSTTTNSSVSAATADSTASPCNDPADTPGAATSGTAATITTATNATSDDKGANPSKTSSVFKLSGLFSAVGVDDSSNA